MSEDKEREAAIEDGLKYILAHHMRGWNPELVASVLTHLRVTYFDENQFENTDQLRLARAGNTKEIEAYKKVWGSGCCGSYDAVVITGGGKNVLIALVGFNYGH
jgi:hypothetical protein